MKTRREAGNPVTQQQQQQQNRSSSDLDSKQASERVWRKKSASHSLIPCIRLRSLSRFPSASFTVFASFQIQIYILLRRRLLPSLLLPFDRRFPSCSLALSLPSLSLLTRSSRASDPSQPLLLPIPICMHTLVSLLCPCLLRLLVSLCMCVCECECTHMLDLAFEQQQRDGKEIGCSLSCEDWWWVRTQFPRLI